MIGRPAHPRAEVELEEAALYYEELRSGLGADFIAAVTEAVAEVTDWPGMGSPVDEGSEPRRRWRVKGFPYYVGYRVTGDNEIRVLTVAYERRRPDFWTGRR